MSRRSPSKRGPRRSRGGWPSSGSTSDPSRQGFPPLARFFEVLSLPRTFVGTRRRAPSILHTVAGAWIKSLQDCTTPRVHTKTEGLRECTSPQMVLQIPTGSAPCKCAFATSRMKHYLDMGNRDSASASEALELASRTRRHRNTTQMS